MTDLFGNFPWYQNQPWLYCQYSPLWPNPWAPELKPGQHYVAHDVSGASTTCSETSSLESSPRAALQARLEEITALAEEVPHLKKMLAEERRLRGYLENKLEGMKAKKVEWQRLVRGSLMRISDLEEQLWWSEVATEDVLQEVEDLKMELEKERRLRAWFENELAQKDGGLKTVCRCDKDFAHEAASQDALIKHLEDLLKMEEGKYHCLRDELEAATQVNMKASVRLKEKLAEMESAKASVESAKLTLEERLSEKNEVIGDLRSELEKLEVDKDKSERLTISTKKEADEKESQLQQKLETAQAEAKAATQSLQESLAATKEVEEQKKAAEAAVQQLEARCEELQMLAKTTAEERRREQEGFQSQLLALQEELKSARHAEHVEDHTSERSNIIGTSTVLEAGKAETTAVSTPPTPGSASTASMEKETMTPRKPIEEEIRNAKCQAFVELKKIEGLPTAERERPLRNLMKKWHPDKNGHQVQVATEVFQFIQKGKQLMG